jgi:hypothetical protein
VTPDNINTLIHTVFTLIWLLAVLGACVYVVRLLLKADTFQSSKGPENGWQPQYTWSETKTTTTPPTGGSSVQSK